MSNSLFKLYELNQSIWYDNISRDALENGQMLKLSESGIFGVTSNPTIFEKAISGSKLYDDSIRKCVSMDLPLDLIIEELMVEDIKHACNIFYPVYKRTNHKDGYVSIEVDPTLAHDTQKTIEAAKHLFKKLNMPNLMIKIPATKEGLPAIEETIYNGINVNVTLIFSIDRYLEVAESYIRGIKRRIAEGKDINNLHSVASVFVSRIDSILDKVISDLLNSGKKFKTVKQGKAAVYNSKLLYQEFKRIFYSDDFKKLNANIQRPLWASTGTKNPNYSPVLYVEKLVGPDTVNTLPPATIEAVLNHSGFKSTIEDDIDNAREFIEEIKNSGVDLKMYLDQLEREGVAAFINSFTGLKKTLKEKITEL